MSSSIDPNNFDTSVKPGDDFFRYTNGGWLDKNPIPADESRWGSFEIMRVNVEAQLKSILDELTSHGDYPAGSDSARIRDFYLTGMDVESRNRAGLEPLAELFEKIDSIKNNDDLAGTIGYLHRLGVLAWWVPFAEQDEKKSEVVALHLYQGGLGLPDRDYYLNDDEKSKKILGDYEAYMKTMLEQYAIVNLNGTSAEEFARGILEIEIELAKASITRVEMRDVEKQYNRMTVAEFGILTPRVHWGKYFEAIKLSTPEYVIVGQPKFFAEVDRLFESMSLDRIKLYLRWHVFIEFARFLTETIEREHFDFYSRTFRGAKEMKPLWRRVLLVVNSALDEMLGKLYVERHFSPDAKKKVNDLVDKLTAAYCARIEKLDWMSAETKQKAIEKLNAVSRKLGYPDVWKDMSALEVKKDSYAQNIMRAQTFEFDRKMRDIGGSVNRTEWLMPPQMVNAYYQPPLNEIAFPAAILQPPFFDPNADDAVNFGGIGATIGHELTHGLDDQGALFDAQGNLRNWWTPEDKERFDAKAAQLAKQFDVYEVLPGTFVNGKLTNGENIADLGGWLIGFDGLKLALKEGSSAEKIDGLTPEQRFFINASAIERCASREEVVRLILQVDPHSPERFRVNGPVSNIPAFYDAFDVKEGDKLWRKPEDRVMIW